VKRLNKRHTREHVTPRRYRTQEFAGSSPARSPIEIRPASQAIMISIGFGFDSGRREPTPAGPA
jgi:hypothetical protein